jgi:hypothetical protein
MLEDDYCEWDMVDEDLTETANVKLKHTTDYSSFYEDNLVDDELPANTQPSRFSVYVEAQPFYVEYAYVDEDEFLPMFAALKF